MELLQQQVNISITSKKKHEHEQSGSEVVVVTDKDLKRIGSVVESEKMPK